MADNLQILKQITDNYDEFNNRDSFSLDKYKIRRLVNDLLILFFPKYFDHWDNDEKTFERIRKDLEDEIKKVDVNYLEYGTLEKMAVGAGYSAETFQGYPGHL